MSKEETVMKLIDRNEDKLELLKEWRTADEDRKLDIEDELEVEFNIELSS